MNEGPLSPEEEARQVRRLVALLDAEKATSLERKAFADVHPVLAKAFYDVVEQVARKYGVNAVQLERVALMAFKGLVITVEHYQDEENGNRS